MKQFEELEKRDIVYIEYGFSHMRCVVVERSGDRVLLWPPQWLRSSVLSATKKEFENWDGFITGRKLNRLRYYIRL